jgi:FixJ family two-component response regulator
MKTNEKAMGPPTTGRPKVLLVEDDAGVRRSVQLLLRARGFEVRAYSSGAALLADEASRDAQCFVADYRMGDLDGLAVHAALLADGWRGPAILITAYPAADLKERAKAQGFNAVVEKPFREYALGEIVSRLINGQDRAGPRTS